jgi:hypothetical protein
VKIALDFSAFVRSPDGTVSDFRLEIEGPHNDPQRGWFCFLRCPVLRTKPYLAFGVDAQQALELSVTFMNQVLLDRNLVLIDADGRAVTLPPPTEID